MDDIVNLLAASDVKLMLTLVIKVLGFIIGMLLAVLCYFLKSTMRKIDQSFKAITLLSSYVAKFEKFDARLQSLEVDVAILVDSKKRK